ncbi:hypothetical protein [Rhizobium leguminosarum]|nr:hypothetical protein [Rhizobium leguminosarum]
MKEWHTGAAAEAYLSGHVSNQMPLRRNVRALARCSRPIFAAWRLTGRPSAPWIPALDMISFVRETMGSETRMHHWPKLPSAAAVMEQRPLGMTAEAIFVVPGHLLCTARKSVFDTLCERSQLYQGQGGPGGKRDAERYRPHHL